MAASKAATSSGWIKARIFSPSAPSSSSSEKPVIASATGLIYSKRFSGTLYR